MAEALDLELIRAQLIESLSQGGAAVQQHVSSPATFYDDLMRLAQTTQEPVALQNIYAAQLPAEHQPCFEAMAPWLVPLILQEHRRLRRKKRRWCAWPVR